MVDEVDIQRSLGRLEGKMDLMLSNMQSHLMEDTARFKLFDDRLDVFDKRQSTLERKAWMASGGVLAIWAAFQLWFNKFFA